MKPDSTPFPEGWRPRGSGSTPGAMDSVDVDLLSQSVATRAQARLVVAIDGPVAAGKSTLALALAELLERQGLRLHQSEQPMAVHDRHTDVADDNAGEIGIDDLQGGGP